MSNGKTFTIFGEKKLDQLLQNKRNNIKTEIDNQPDNYILNVNETDFVSYVIDKYSMGKLEFQFDNHHISDYEKEIPVEELDPFERKVFRNSQKCKKNIVRYHIPFEGEDELLYYRPAHHVNWFPEVLMYKNCICFDLILHDDSRRMQIELDSILSFLKQQSTYVTEQVDQYNNSLENLAKNLFKERKEHLLKKNNLLASLGVPIIKRENVSQTFAIPTPQTRKKIHVSRPAVAEKEFRSEPTLEISVYQDILQIVHDVGKQFERMPSTYADKLEEDLRDHILLFLEPNFKGSATGETFNKTGKTDILLRHENSNVFIAECKFWKGAKGFLETIDQLFGYLTWRDSKAALVIFVKNKEFSSVIDTVETEICKHSNFLSFEGKKDETWLNYRFHINDDRNREVKLAVLLFHIPPLK